MNPIIFKLGCRTHATNFGLGAGFFPGFHWTDHYACKIFAFQSPIKWIEHKVLICPHCNNKVGVLIPSKATGEKLKMIFIFFSIVFLLLVLYILIFSLDYLGGFAMLVKVWGTIFGILLSLLSFVRAFNSYSARLSNPLNQIRRHKLYSYDETQIQQILDSSKKDK